MKVPEQPPSTFATEARHLRAFTKDQVLWRIYRTTGPHALAWNELRHFGPVAEQRWDPQANPAAISAEAGVLYAAGDSTTAFAEVYQGRREITRSQGGATLVAWQPSRDLTLLDLTTNWPVQNGAAAAIMMGDKTHTQAWARAIHLRMGAEVDGLFAQSSITNKPVITLFSRTEVRPAFPARPRFHSLLSDAVVDAIVSHAARELSYKVL